MTAATNAPIVASRPYAISASPLASSIVRDCSEMPSSAPQTAWIAQPEEREREGLRRARGHTRTRRPCRRRTRARARTGESRVRASRARATPAPSRSPMLKRLHRKRMKTSGLTKLAMRHGRLRASKKRVAIAASLSRPAVRNPEDSAVDHALAGKRDAERRRPARKASRESRNAPRVQRRAPPAQRPLRTRESLLP